MERLGCGATMKRLQILRMICLALLVGTAAQAQTGLASYQVMSSPANLKFTVDGMTYQGTATFLWVAGSNHTLAAINDQEADNAISVTDFQTKYAFVSWQVNNGSLAAPQQSVQIIVANPASTIYTVTYQKVSRVTLQYRTTPVIGAEPLPCPTYPFLPADPTIPGEVYLNGACFLGSWAAWLPTGQTFNLGASPYPGYAFLGWSVNGAPPNPLVTSVAANGPMLFAPIFVKAKRILLRSSPPGLKVVIDRQVIRTPPTGFFCNVSPRELCPGDLDWAPSSSHTLSATSPQTSLEWGPVVFDQWDPGGGQNSVYTVTNTNQETLTAKFMLAMSVGILTEPDGLKLTVDGVTAARTGYVYWGIGTKHTVSAPADQIGSTGNKYVFQGWSNGGPVAQDITADEATLGTSHRLIANYERLAHITVKSTVPGAKVVVDGTECTTPCGLDRSVGATINLSPADALDLGSGTQIHFDGWADGGPATRVYVVPDNKNHDLQMNFSTFYQLVAVSKPAEGAQIQFAPTSPDGYYRAGAQVTVKAVVETGYKFRRWTGDVDAILPSVVMNMTSPKNIQASLDEVPHISKAGVVNAAGLTPEQAVAPGSLISIYGDEFTGGEVLQAEGAFKQILGGISVRIGADTLLPIMFVSPTQINALLPSYVKEGSYRLTIIRDGQDPITGDVKVVRNNPGIFQTVDPSQPEGSDPIGLALHLDYSVVSALNPAKHGETIIFYSTGIGPLSKPYIDGFPFPTQPLNTVVDALQVLAGDATVPADWAGAAPGMIGVEQVNFKIGDQVPSGALVPFTFRAGGKSSNTVKIPVE